MEKKEKGSKYGPPLFGIFIAAFGLWVMRSNPDFGAGFVFWGLVIFAVATVLIHFSEKNEG